VPKNMNKYGFFAPPLVLHSCQAPEIIENFGQVKMTVDNIDGQAIVIW
jgi:hypothetical protein